jgi:hypothetical protein
MNQKFVYDIRSKALVSHFAYQPFAVERVFNFSGHTVFLENDKAKLVAVEFRPGESPEFRILAKDEAAPWLTRVETYKGSIGPEQEEILHVVPDDPEPIRFGESDALTFDHGSIVASHDKKYPLPQSTYDGFAKVRPGRVADGYVRENVTIDETIGPVQLEGDKLWFGKTFSDEEGDSGVGGFGYFDAKDRQYHLFIPPEVADFAISAILVEPDTVWMSILHYGEYGGCPAGVLRYDRKTHTVHKYDLPDFVSGLVASGNRVLAATSSGVAVVDGDEATRYFVDRTTDGRLRIAQATR